MESRTETIRELNDNLRNSLSGGRVVITDGVKSQGEDITQEVIELVRDYNAFTEDNNQYMENDFGDLIFNDIKYFWKIDYYNLEYCGLSENPADSELTNRVLTIFLASEY